MTLNSSCIQNQEILASSLQTAANLGVLASVVAELVKDLTEAIENRIRTTFDMISLAREIAAKGELVDGLCDAVFNQC